jgi:osmotically-inducible protein OsmY
MTTATDLLQSMKIRVGLLSDGNVSGCDVEVEVDNGIARLTGTVETEQQKMEIEEIAAAVEGVVEIEDEIVVEHLEDQTGQLDSRQMMESSGMVGQAKAPAAYGGPAPGVYTVVSPETISEVDDEELLNRVKDAIILEDRINSDSVSAHVYAGVVYLHGAVTTFDQLGLVEGAVMSVPGVESIRNNIEVKEAGCRECNEW